MAADVLDSGRSDVTSALVPVDVLAFRPIALVLVVGMLPFVISVSVDAVGSQTLTVLFLESLVTLGDSARWS